MKEKLMTSYSIKILLLFLWPMITIASSPKRSRSMQRCSSCRHIIGKQKPSPIHYHEWILPCNYESLPYHDDEHQVILNEVEKTCTQTKRLFHQKISLHPKSLQERIQHQHNENKELYNIYDWTETKQNQTLHGTITKIPEYIVITITTITKINGTEISFYKK